MSGGKVNIRTQILGRLVKGNNNKHQGLGAMRYQTNKQNKTKREKERKADLK